MQSRGLEIIGITKKLISFWRANILLLAIKIDEKARSAGGVGRCERSTTRTLDGLES